MPDHDTIAALATPAGTGGVAMIRVSGPRALAVALSLLDCQRLEPRHATHTILRANGQPLDDIVALFFPGPHSYTGEDTVELSTHGSPYIQQAALQALLDAGARLAQPGEYTLRAFRNGRLNLSQAEAVADLIEATTPAAHRLAISQLRGGYAYELRELRAQMVDLTALLELELDFSQEDVEFADRTELHSLMSTLQARIKGLLDSFATGNAFRHGIPVAIVGEPNVGKSTLLNTLLNDDRAIVSATPGTTRDTIEAPLNIDGVAFRLIDTAGLRSTVDEVERLGIMRSHRAIDEADIIIEVRDATAGPGDIPAHNDGKSHIVVVNKCDRLERAWQLDGQRVGNTLVVCTAAKEGKGIDRVKRALSACAPQFATDVMLTNPRHREALTHVSAALRQADAALADGLPADLVAVDLRDALYHLGTITGEVANDDILASVFSRFCIGK